MIRSLSTRKEGRNGGRAGKKRESTNLVLFAEILLRLSPHPWSHDAIDGAAAARRLPVHGASEQRGEGVTRNLATAAIWYSEAADHGDEIAAERLEELRAETRDIFKGMRFV